MKLWIATICLWATVFTIDAKPKPLVEVHIVSAQAGIDIRTKKVIHLIGPIRRASIREAAREHIETLSIPGDRVVIIDSGGGEVERGQTLIDALMIERSMGVRIVCVAVNHAHSMAFNTLSFCDVRLATAGTTMVAHKIEFGRVLPDIRTTAKNLRMLARELDEVDERYCVQNAKMLHLDRKHYDMYADHENEWTAEQLLAMQYLNGIATVGK